MNSIYLPVLELARKAYEHAGAKFSYELTEDPRMGYYIEPWTNQCLVGPQWTEGQPEPISLDWADERITEQEAVIREWIGAAAHGLAVAGIVREAPAGWKSLADEYEPDWPEVEFGATVVLFRVG